MYVCYANIHNGYIHILPCLPNDQMPQCHTFIVCKSWNWRLARDWRTMDWSICASLWPFAKILMCFLITCRCRLPSTGISKNACTWRLMVMVVMESFGSVLNWSKLFDLWRVEQNPTKTLQDLVSLSVPKEIERCVTACGWMDDGTNRWMEKSFTKNDHNFLYYM